MFYIGNVICLKTSKRLNIAKEKIYTAYKDALQNDYEIIIDDDHKIHMHQKRFDEYFKLKEL